MIDSKNTCYKDRVVLYCVSIPGEAPWVVDGFRQLEADTAIAGCSKQSNKLKRTIEEHQEDEEDVMDTSEVTNDVENKRVKLDNGQSTSGVGNGNVSKFDLNLPLPNTYGKACIVKLKRSIEDCINHCFEFIGIVSLDPSLAGMPKDGNDADFLDQEQMACSPPPSLVPRLHVIKFKKLLHCNPHLPQEIPAEFCQEEIAKCREEMHSILTQALMGDALAADYLLCHLVRKKNKHFNQSMT